MRDSDGDWSRAEVEAIVADYLEMLLLEREGRPFNKSEHRRVLRDGALMNRSDASIEFKHRNISAVLDRLGYPYVKGYRPAWNYQQLLLDVTASVLSDDRALGQVLSSEIDQPAQVPPLASILDAWEEAPEPRIRDQVAERQAIVYTRRYVRVTDFIAREASNRLLGKAGESFVVDYEKARLIKAGAENLVSKVEHVSLTQGDGLGFDVLSYEPDGRERFIEVKTTGFGKESHFYVSHGELTFSRERSSQFHLYRVFEFRKLPRLFGLHGALDDVCRLAPIQYVGDVA